MKKNNHTETDKKITELMQEIKYLYTELDCCRNMNEILSTNYEQVNSERNNYRRIIKYHSLLMVLANLLTQSDAKTDIDRILKQNIMNFYKAMTNDLMTITEDEDETFDDEEYEEDAESAEDEF
jgi:deoxyribose-phosphate aldolase